MEKTFESVSNNLFIKKYSLKDDNIFDLLNIINSSEFKASYVSVDEDVENDMKSVSGTFSLDGLINKYSELISYVSNIDTLSIYILGSFNEIPLSFLFYPGIKNILIFQSSGVSLEFDDILEKKNNDLTKH